MIQLLLNSLECVVYLVFELKLQSLYRTVKYIIYPLIQLSPTVDFLVMWISQEILGVIC